MEKKEFNQKNFKTKKNQKTKTLTCIVVSSDNMVNTLETKRFR